MVKFNDIFYVPQLVKSILIVLMLVSKGYTMEATKENIIIDKNGINAILDARKGKNDITMVYLKDQIYPPEGLSPQEANSNLPEEK